MRKANLAIGLLLGTFAAVSAQSLTTWSKYKDIAINTKASGANVGAVVTNFPVLVRLDSVNANDVFTGALASGADLRFAKTNGTTLLAYEIESWDVVAKKAAIWVRLDSVKANDSSSTFRLYWGNASATSLSSGPAVFDTASGFTAVWHMNGTTTETSSTGHGFVATPPVDSTPTAIAAAAVGTGRRFSGTQYLRAIGSAATALSYAAESSYTLSAWTRADSTVPTGTNTGHAILTKGDHQYALALFNSAATPNRWYEITTKIGGGTGGAWRQTTTDSNSSLSYPGVYANSFLGQWKYVVGTWTGNPLSAATGRIYIDGVLQKTVVFNAVSGSRQTARDVHIGVLSNLGTNNTGATGSLQRFFVGGLDEVRAENTLRDSNWIKLNFHTQKASSVVALGTTQNNVVTPVAITNIRYVMDAVEGSPTNPRDTLVFTVNTPVNLDLKFDGGPMDSAKLTGNNVTLPAGLSINLLTGKLSGTPTALFAAGNRTLTVYSSLGNPTRGLRISVVPGPLAGLDYATDTAVYVTGLPINANSASWSALGRAPTGFSVTPALPAGLTLNATNGAISGTPTAVAAAANYVVKAFNATDSAFATVRLSVVSVAAEDYAGSAWPNKQTVWLNTQGNGAGVANTVTNFPVLVRLDSTNFNAGFAQSAVGGVDIRFTKLNNTTRLNHQIERWDAAAKKAEIWVLVDSVKGNAISSVRMHWGNATAPNLSSGPSVFDTTSGFQAVWHMNATSGNENDASTNGFAAVAAAAPGTAAGVIGPARSFNGTSDFFRVPSTASGKLNFTQADSYTLSAWINPTAIATGANTGHKIIDKGDNQYVLATYGSSAENRWWEITIRGNDTFNQCQADSGFNLEGNPTANILTGKPRILASSSVNAWNHLVGTYSGGAVGEAVTQRLYYNGELVGECPITNSSTGGRNENVDVHLGVQSGAAPSGTYTRYWNGLLDEPRLHSRARSADWIKLEYQNQRAAQTLVTIGATGPTGISSANAASVSAQVFGFKSVGQGLAFQMSKAHEGKAVLSLMDMTGRTVWSGSFAPGATQLLWNGSAKNGMAVNSGIYMARLSLLNNQGKAIQVQDRKVPYTR